MSDAIRDNNYTPSILGVSNVDSAPVPIKADPATGRLLVDANGDGAGTSMDDDAPFTPGTTAITPAGAMFDDVAPDSVDEGDAGVVRMSANRNLYSTLRDAAGNERGANVNASNELTVVEANSAAIKTAVEALDNAIDGTEMQVDVVTSTLPTGAATAANQTTIIGHVDGVEALLTTIDTDTSTLAGAIAGTEMQVDVVAALPAGDNNVGNVDIVTLPASIDGPGAPTIDSYSNIPINLTTGANQVLVSSAADKQIWVYAYGFTCGSADGQTVSLQDEDDTAVTGVMEFGQYGGISVPPSGNFAMPIHKLATNKDLEVDITGGDVDGFLTYAIVSV